MAAVHDVLSDAEYEEVLTSDSWRELSRVFEDYYGIAYVVVYDTWNELHDKWHRAQGELVDLLSRTFLRPEPKSWEGYLVLLTPGRPPTSRRHEVTSLRYNTKRVRKIVATGDELQTLGDVETALLPLIPLTVGRATTSGTSLLERLPELLENEGVSRDVTRVAVQAFLNNDSIVDKLHERRDRQ